MENKTVLIPNQTPMAIEGADQVSISSVGYDSNGDFHIQFAFGEAVQELKDAVVYPVIDRELYDRSGYYEEEGCYFLSLEGGRYVDCRFENLAGYDLEEILPTTCNARFWTQPLIRGEWSLTFPLEILPARSVATEEQISGMRVECLDLTAMTLRVSAAYEDPERGGYLGAFPAALILEDGAQVPLAYYDHRWLYVQDGVKSTQAYGERYGVLGIWSYPRAIDPQDVAGVAIGLRYIPLDGGPGHWLTELPGEGTE